MIANIERAAVAAVPAIEAEEMNGWLLQASGGAVGRINAVATFGHRLEDFEPAVAQVGRWYRERGLDPAFRLTPLDGWLAPHLSYAGYGPPSPPVVVMTRTLSDVGPASAPAADWDIWHEAVRAFTGASPTRARELRASTARIAAPALPVAVGGDEPVAVGPVAVGLGVVTEGLLGVFDVAVDPGHRRRGHARRVMELLTGWGVSQGAEAAYLQVHSENRPALALYESLGFTEAYRYAYSRA